MSEIGCNHEPGCITCGDVALPLTVIKVLYGRVALCTDEGGGWEDVDISLVESVCEGDLLLVHAGVALQRLERRTVTGQRQAVSER